MRQLAPRGDLDQVTAAELATRANEIAAIVDVDQRKTRARAIFNSARDSNWFAPVVTALKTLCGEADVCMYCSANEPSQVEHYRPLSPFPQFAMSFGNYLWTCDICNRSYKGSRFPPDTEAGAMILNPIDDNVWDYFFLDDQYGRLLKRVDPQTSTELVRATSTCEVVGIDREAVQQRRAKRYKALRRDAAQSLADHQAGVLPVHELRDRIQEWLTDPFQADVADYFLNGPGKAKDPFHSVLAAANAV